MPDLNRQNKVQINKKKKGQVRTNKINKRRSPKQLQKIKDLFLSNLEHHANVTEAFNRTPGIKYITQIYAWRNNDDQFRAEFDKVRELIAGTLSDRLEDEVITRATRGKVKKIYYQGVETAQEYEPSDDLLKFALKANSPKYAGTDEQLSHIQINIQSFDSKGMPIEGEFEPEKPKQLRNTPKKVEIDINPLGKEN